MLLRELFFNILDNAVKFSSKQDEVKLKIWSEVDKNHTIYYVKDNGIGMDAENQDLPFLMFKKIHKIPDLKGNGIGLAVVKRIAERLKAKISFRSEIKKGTIFEIKFNNE